MSEEKKINKKSKKILIIAIVVAILVGIVIGSIMFFKYHGEQLALLGNEVNTLANLEMNENTTIDMEIKTEGSYAVIEKTMKDYINEVLQLAKQAETVYNTTELESLMTSENLIKDGPEFTKTKETIAQYKEKVEEYMNQFLVLVEENNILSAIDDKEVNDYYKELYKQLMIDSETSENLNKTKNELEEAKTNLSNILDTFNEMFEFLSSNKNSWTLSNGQIMFYSQAKLDEYKQIVNKLKEF